MVAVASFIGRNETDSGRRRSRSDPGGYLYTSIDSGATWTAQTGAGKRYWASVASSSDGTKLVAVDGSRGMETAAISILQHDSGATWTGTDDAGKLLDFCSSCGRQRTDRGRLQSTAPAAIFIRPLIPARPGRSKPHRDRRLEFGSIVVRRNQTYCRRSKRLCLTLRAIPARIGQSRTPLWGPHPCPLQCPPTATKLSRSIMEQVTQGASRILPLISA